MTNLQKYIVCGLVAVIIILSVVCVILSLKIRNNSASQESEEKVTQMTEQNETTNPSNEPSKKKPEQEVTQEHLNVMKKAMANVSGECQWGYKIFSTGEEYMTEGKAVPSASVIKVFIMEYAFDQITQGKLALTDTFSGNTVQNHLTAMITRSDNNATNVLIEAFGMEEMNQFFQAKGYRDTKVQRKMLDTRAQQAGKDNYTSVSDVMNFLDKMYQNRKQEPYRSMLDIMKRQEVKTKIPRKFPADVVIANKTGELSNVENDIGILFGEKGDYAVAFLCSNLTDTVAARNAISDAAYQFYQTVEE